MLPLMCSFYGAQRTLTDKQERATGSLAQLALGCRPLPRWNCRKRSYSLPQACAVSRNGIASAERHERAGIRLRISAAGTT